MGEVDNSQMRCWVSSASSTVDGLVCLISKVTVTVQWAGRPRRTRSVCSGDMSMFRGHILLGGKKLPCDPALASAGLCVRVSSDWQNIWSQWSYAVWQQGMSSPSMCYFQSLMPGYLVYDLECDRNLSMWARPVGTSLDPVSAACALCVSGEHPSEIVLPGFLPAVSHWFTLEGSPGAHV